VLAAASLTGSFTALGKAFEAAHPGARVTFSFGPSSGLATQVLAGAPADVFASASPKSMKQVTDGGAATGPVVFATNVAEIAAAPGSTITGLADLAAPGVKVALCQPQVPCGALATTVLANAQVTVKPVTQGLDVKSTLAYVTNGSADAAIVYVTDVRAAGDKVKGVQIPAAVNASTAYEIAPLKDSKHAALAQAFEDYVLSAAGQSALQTAGFQKP
jgi:molybdate transport system substrate-binding protein